jgi:hypothetical protein
MFLICPTRHILLDLKIAWDVVPVSLCASQKLLLLPKYEDKIAEYDFIKRGYAATILLPGLFDKAFRPVWLNSTASCRSRSLNPHDNIKNTELNLTQIRYLYF